MPTNRATLELFAALDRSSPEPLRAQLEDAICDAITGGGLPAGTRLPASRVLQVDSRTWDATKVGDVMTPIDRIEKLTYETEVLRALEAMYASEVRELPVIDENQVQGFVGMDALLKFVASRMTSENGRAA